MQIGSTHPVHGHEAAHGQTAAKAAGDSAHSQQSQAVPGGEAAEAVAGKDRSEQEEKHVVTMMAEALEASSGKLLLFGTKKTTSGFKSPTDKPKDTSSQLTQRLVGAKGQFEVRQVIASASSELVKLRIAAAGCKGKEAEAVRSYIRKLERLISRAGSKIKDLDKEDMMEIQKARAQKKQQLRRVEEIKAELRKKRVGRRAKDTPLKLLSRARIQNVHQGHAPLSGRTPKRPPRTHTRVNILNSMTTNANSETTLPRNLLWA